MRKQYIITLATLILCFSVSAQSWYPIDSPTNRELKTIQFISDEIGFIGGDSILMKTIDGGITWNEIVSEVPSDGWPSYLDVYDLHFFDENHGYIMSGLYGAMLETFDGGLTWEGVGVSDGFCQQSSLYFENEDYGFAGGAGCFEGHIIGKYENGTWTQVEDPEDWSGGNYVTCINFKNAELGLAGTSGGKILRTTDGGDVWDTIPNLAAGFLITDIDFDGDLIRVTHHNIAEFGSMISTDDGLNWEVDPELSSFFYPKYNALHTTSEGVAYAAGSLPNNDFINGIIFERQELMWNPELLVFKVNDMDSHSGSSVFGVGEFGVIYTNQEDIANGISELENEKLRVFPNPVASGDALTIDLTNCKSCHLRLEDMRGVSVLDEPYTQGGIKLDGISTGIYILRAISTSSPETSKSIKVVVK